MLVGRARAIVSATMLASCFFATDTASASDWPRRPVTVVSPYSAGLSVDTLIRTLAADLSSKLGQQFVVENNPGCERQYWGGCRRKGSSRRPYTISGDGRSDR